MLRFIVQQIDVHLRLLFLNLSNRFGRAPLICSGGPVVSLTTHGQRAQTVYLAIESIGRGLLRPSRLILWVDERDVIENLPQELFRLQRRGLEIELCDNFGPHKKYYPYVQNSELLNAPLVTADDDILYPRTWLKNLIDEFRAHPDVINCYRARVIKLGDGGLRRYTEWHFASSTHPSYLHIAGSGAGAVYPTRLQRALKQGGTRFMSCCPKADDIWLHIQAIRAGFMIRQIQKRRARLVTIPHTQTCALWVSNVSDNDVQMKATYTRDDIRILEADISR